MIHWPAGVPQTVLRSSKWDFSMGFIADKTRSGKEKRRAALYMAPDVYTVTVRMSLGEYHIFIEWFKIDCLKGLLSFGFPKIDDAAGALTEYRFSPDSKISLSNPAGQALDVSMVWEEV
jgi:hypothetical protein